eukprot:GEMP01027840.1.p1 GENE.GEMP01027840.1~~GEMP01027840.1.p1  ORF type:complete len:270 (+),score=35.80 GEMP01027840.1:343-1152(+)
MSSPSFQCPKAGGCPANRLKWVSTTEMTNKEIKVVCEHVTAADGSANSGTVLVPLRFDIRAYNYCCVDKETSVTSCEMPIVEQARLQEVQNLKSEADNSEENANDAKLGLIAAIVLFVLTAIVLFIWLCRKISKKRSSSIVIPPLTTSEKSPNPLLYTPGIEGPSDVVSHSSLTGTRLVTVDSAKNNLVKPETRPGGGTQSPILDEDAYAMVMQPSASRQSARSNRKKSHTTAVSFESDSQFADRRRVMTKARRKKGTQSSLQSAPSNT